MRGLNYALLVNRCLITIEANLKPPSPKDKNIYSQTRKSLNLVMQAGRTPILFSYIHTRKLKQ